MTIEALVAVAPPPPEPFEPFNGPWDAIEAELGIELPQDYKDFARAYGSGDFMEFLSISIPRTTDPHFRLELQCHLIQQLFPKAEERPAALWPEVGGLFLITRTLDSHAICWLMHGPPDEWTIQVWDRGLQAWQGFDCGLTDFLAGLATGSIVPDAFPEDFLDLEPEKFFQPYRLRPA